MDSARDEAHRAMEMMEKKFRAQDFSGAKKLALEARQLYPSLEGLTRRTAVLDVYLAAEKKINGKADWYGILQVNSVADEALIKKQYRNLALLLHPDKNKSTGAEGAFKIVGEAWSVLSDQLKRSVYDRERNLTPEKNTTQKPPNAPTEGYYYMYPPRQHRNASSSNPPATIWTACPMCGMQHNLLMGSANRRVLICPNCLTPSMLVVPHAHQLIGAAAFFFSTPFMPVFPRSHQPTGPAAFFFPAPFRGASYFHTASYGAFAGMP